jgi:hypothetical protein
MKRELIEKAYELAKERYAAIGVDVEAESPHFLRYAAGEYIVQPCADLTIHNQHLLSLSLCLPKHTTIPPQKLWTN